MHELSGGEQQRVALARALVIEPGLLLLDEPLSNLDARLRVQMRAEIRRLQRSLDITMVYVTHDQEEAMSIADRIVVMNHGKIEQVGTTREIYDSPATRFVAGFIGEINFIPARVENGDLHILGKVVPGFSRDTPDRALTCALRPEKIKLAAGGEGVGAVVKDVVFLGSIVRYGLNITGEQGENITIHVDVPPPKAVYAAGENVRLVFEPADLLAYEENA